MWHYVITSEAAAESAEGIQVTKEENMARGLVPLDTVRSPHFCLVLC